MRAYTQLDGYSARLANTVEMTPPVTHVQQVPCARRVSQSLLVVHAPKSLACTLFFKSAPDGAAGLHHPTASAVPTHPGGHCCKQSEEQPWGCPYSVSPRSLPL